MSRKGAAVAVWQQGLWVLGVPMGWALSQPARIGSRAGLKEQVPRASRSRCPLGHPGRAVLAQRPSQGPSPARPVSPQGPRAVPAGLSSAQGWHCPLLPAMSGAAPSSSRELPWSQSRPFPTRAERGGLGGQD